MKNILILVFTLFTTAFGFGQTLFSGQVLDEMNEPIPGAKIFVKNDADQRTLCDVDGRFEMRLMPGEYYLIITFSGYDDREVYLGLGDEPIVKNIQLFPSNIQDIESVEVSTKKTNPGRDIILEVVRRRDTISQWNYPHIVDVYSRATEKIERKEKKKSKKDEKKKEEKKDDGSNDDEDLIGLEDPFEAEKKKNEQRDRNMNMVEVQLKTQTTLQWR